MGIWLGLGLGSAALSKGGGSIASIFANGEEGFLYFPLSETERQFLTSTGGLQVTSDGNAVGLALDSSKWGGKTLAAWLATQAELFIPGASVDASTAPSTTSESPPGTVTLNADGTNGARRNLSFASAAGKKYLVSMTASAAMSVRAGTAAGGATLLSDTVLSAGTYKFLITATGSTTWLRWFGSLSGARTITSISIREAPGNQASQATPTKRFVWQSNSGKPYWLADGADDFENTPRTPGSAGTIAVAFRSSAASVYAVGGGTSTGNKRMRMGLGATGVPEFVYNDQFNSIASAGDRRNTDALMLQTWDAAGNRECWLDGTPAFSESRAPNLDGTGNTYALGSGEGGGANFLNGRLYAAFEVDRKLTPSEIAFVNNMLKRSYQ